ncbi:formate/nitrite transporter family protein [bacterium]|nr:formate/nitrite transporter family protein [bacterium]
MSDEQAKKTGEEILAVQRQEARTEMERPALGLALSGLSAGLDVGFSLLVIAVLSSLLGESSRPIRELACSLGYSIGFLFVILGRSELFSEHTTMDILPVLNGEKSLLSLVRLWVIVFCSNLVGATAFAWAAAGIGPALGIFPSSILEDLARPLVSFPSGVLFASSVFAGWLMGLLGWLVAASKETISQILIVVLVTGCIGLCHFHHCIAGSVDVLAAIFAGESIGWGDFLHFLTFTTLGNALGGAIFVALIKHGHIAFAEKKEHL